MSDNQPKKLDSGQYEGHFEVGPEKLSFFDVPKEAPERPYGFKETFATAVARDNFIPNVVWKASDVVLTAYEQLTYDGIEGYDPLSEEERSKYDPKYWPLVGDSKSPWQAARKVYKAQQEEYYNHILENGSIWGTITAGAYNGVTSPVQIPILMKTIANPTFLKSFATGAAQAIPSMLAGNVIEEGILQYTQETRKLEESVLNIATGTVIGSLMSGLGGGARYLWNKNVTNRVVRETLQGAEVRTLVSPEGEPIGFNVQDGGTVGDKTETLLFKEHPPEGKTGFQEHVEREKAIQEGASVGAMESKLDDIEWTAEDYKPVGTGKWYQPATYLFGLAGKVFRNPSVRGAQAKSKHTSQFIYEALESNFDVEGSYKHGKRSVASLQSQIKKREAENIAFQMDYIDFYNQNCGLDKDGNKVANIALSKMSKKGLSLEEFGRRVQIAIVNDGVDAEYPIVEACAKMAINKHLQKDVDELVALNIVPPNFTPFGANRHLQRIYDKPNIVANRTRGLNHEGFLAKKFSDVNEKIMARNQPIEDLHIQLGKLETQKGVLKNDAFDKDITKMQKKIRQEKKKLRDEIIQGKYPPEMLVGDRGMTWEQIQGLKKLRKPIKKLKSEVNIAEQDLKAYKRELNEGRKPFEPNLPADAKQLSLEAKLKESQEKLKSLRDEMNKKVKAGELDESLFFKTKNDNYRLKKINYGTLKFRRILTEEECKLAATRAIDNILGMSQEQIAQEIAGTFKSGGMGNPMQQRQLLIPDVDLYQQKMLIGDPRQTIAAMKLRNGRLITMNKYFMSKGWRPDSGKSHMDWLAEGVHSDYEELRKAVNLKYDAKVKNAKSPKQIEKLEKKAAKELIRLDKEMESEILLNKRTYNRIMGYLPEGRFSNKELIRTSRFLNNWAYSSQLGLLALTQLGEAAAPIMRVGFKPMMTDAAIPLLKGLVKMKGDNKRLKAGLKDWNMAIDTIKSLYSLSHQVNQEFDLPMNFAERTVEKGANLMGLMNLSNLVSDTFRAVGGIASRSNMYRRVLKFNKGKLKGNELAQFKVLRMNDEKLCQEIAKEMDVHAEKINGAWVPNTHKWENAEAAARFEMAVRQELDSTNFSGKDMSSYPELLEFRGISNSFLMYMGWGLTAFSNYTLPLSQRFDYRKWGGAALMIALSSLQDPLRKLMKGEELDEEEDLDPWKMLVKGAANSGVGGIAADMFNRANASFDIIESLKVDRFADKNKLELISGAPYSFINFVGMAVAMGVTQEFNKSDLKTEKRNIPLVEALFLKKLGNDLIDSLDIPETRAKAKKEKQLEEGTLPEKKKKKVKKKK